MDVVEFLEKEGISAASLKRYLVQGVPGKISGKNGVSSGWVDESAYRKWKRANLKWNFKIGKETKAQKRSHWARIKVYGR